MVGTWRISVATFGCSANTRKSTARNTDVVIHKVSRKGVDQITTLLAVVVLLLIVFVLVAYFFVLPGQDHLTDQKPMLSELELNLEKWQNQQPPSFRYVIHRSCSCPRTTVEPYAVTEERGNKTASFNVAIESETGEFLDSPPDPVWIDDLYGLIEQSIHAEEDIRVEYDASYGFPKLVDISRGRDPESSTDHYEVWDFEVLEYHPVQ